MNAVPLPGDRQSSTKVVPEISSFMAVGCGVAGPTTHRILLASHVFQIIGRCYAPLIAVPKSSPPCVPMCDTWPDKHSFPRRHSDAHVQQVPLQLSKDTVRLLLLITTRLQNQ
jgi:hypothetical protein